MKKPKCKILRSGVVMPECGIRPCSFSVKTILLFFLLSVTVILSAQDFGFGFGDREDGDLPGPGKAPGVSISGEAAASMTGYTDDFSGGADHVSLGNIFSGKLNFSASSSIAEAIINLKLKPLDLPAGLISLDEAYVRAFYGIFGITAGIRKLTWGKADSFGPLDVINPLDYSQIFVEMADNTSLMGIKIARPLVHAVLRLGDFTRVEGVFVPWFEPHKLPDTGRWTVTQMEMLKLAESMGIASKPDLTSLEYAQAGLRFTTTIGSADIGAQYYYGRLARPSADIVIDFTNWPLPPDMDVGILYNPYHQIGLDYAQVLFGFNIRAELAANITGDLKGDDGSVYNPSIAWSLGFDRDIVWGVNLNLQVNESIRLFQDQLGEDINLFPVKLASNPASLRDSKFDIEGGLPLTSTRLSAAISRKFLRDELELRTAAAWGIEDSDCIIMPAIIWTRNDMRLSFSGGIFAGSHDGEIGQYHDNHFLKVSMSYTF